MMIKITLAMFAGPRITEIKTTCVAIIEPCQVRQRYQMRLFPQQKIKPEKTTQTKDLDVDIKKTFVDTTGLESS